MIHKGTKITKTGIQNYVTIKSFSAEPLFQKKN